MKFKDCSEARKANTINPYTVITCTTIDIVAEVPSLQEIIIRYERETDSYMVKFYLIMKLQLGLVLTNS